MDPYPSPVVATLSIGYTFPPQPPLATLVGENAYTAPPGNASVSFSSNSRNFSTINPNSCDYTHKTEASFSDSQVLSLKHDIVSHSLSTHSTCVPITQPISQTHSMTNQSMNNIHQPKQLKSTTKHPIPTTMKPTCVCQTFYELHWRATMSEELTTLMHHGMQINSPTKKLHAHGV